MKKSVLLFVSLLLATVSAIAQPAKPEVTYSAWVEETDVYLYNVEASMFLVGSNNWGTRAAVVGGGSNSNIITYDKFLTGNGTIKGTKWQIIQAEDKRGQNACFQISNVEISGRGLIPSGANECWVDGGPAHGDATLRDIDGWYIVKDNGDKTFQLNFVRKAAKKDEAGNEVKEGNEVVYEYTPAPGVMSISKFSEGELNVNISETESYCTWAIVTVEEYERVVPLLNLYHAGVGLQKLIDDAKALGIEADLSSYEAVLTKEGVTLEEIQNAIKKLSPTVNFGKVIAEAKKQDPERDWSKYEGIYADPESTDEIFTKNTNFINALLTLKKAIAAAQELDGTKTFLQAEALYADDDVAQAEIEDETKRVNAYASLKKVLDEAAQKNYNVAEYTAVYNNADATTEDLAKAEEGAKNAVTSGDIASAAANATAENPADFTNYIVNPSFDVQEDFHGWSTGFGAGGTKSTNAEVYGKSFDVYQDIKNMPAGVYMVAVNGYTRYKDAQSDYNAWKAGQVSETKIYLQGETNGQYFTPIKHVSEGGSFTSVANEETTVKLDTEWGTITAGGPVTLYCPNTMAAADVYYHKSGENAGPSDRYRNEAYGPLGEGDVLRIGVFNSKATGSDWSIFDDFQLFYLGNGADAYQKWAESVKGNYNVTFDGDVYYGAPEKKYYEEILEALSSASDKDAVSTAILKVDQAVDSVAASKEAYATYATTLATVQKWLNENAGDDDSYYKLSDYMEAENAEDVATWEFPNGPAKVIIPNYQQGGFEGILPVKDIIAETQYVKDMLTEATRNTLADNTNLTSLIVNPGFEENLVDGKGKGWSLDTSKGGTGSLTNWRGGDSKNYCAEAYEQNFDVYQEIEGVKDGLYEVSVQAFYRGGWPEAAWDNYKKDPDMKGDAKVYSEVYLNEFSTPIRNVMEITFDTNLADNCSSFAEGEGDNVVNVFVPNGMASASAAFSLPDNEKNYTMSAYGLVTDGKIRLGIRRLTTPPSNAGTWTLWDNFKLTYRAKNPEIVEKVLVSKSNELAELLETNEENLTDPVLKSAQEAYTESKKTNLNDNAKYDVLIETNDALVAAKENIQQVGAYKTANEAYQAACDELEKVDESQEADIWNQIDEMDDELEGDAFRSLSTEELVTLIAKVKAFTDEVKTATIQVQNKDIYADMATATDENPYDATVLITNPTYENGNDDGWSYEGDAPGRENRSDMCEYYKKKFNYYQTIYTLPAGTYEVSVQCYARYNDDQNADLKALEEGTKVNLLKAHVYALVGEGSYAEQFRLVSEGAVTDDFYKDSQREATSAVQKDENDQFIKLYTPNNMQMAGKAFDAANKAEKDVADGVEGAEAWDDAKAYRVRVVFTLDEVSNVTIGVKDEVATDWCIWDNWKLTYFGDASTKENSGTAIESVTASQQKNGKFIENGRIIIIKNGVKYNVAGQIIK